MAATVTDNDAASRWEARLEGQVVGYAAYEKQPGTVTLTHTVVDPAQEGHGLGGQLVRAALDDARAQGLRVVPVCAYARSWLDRHPDYADLVTDA